MRQAILFILFLTLVALLCESCNSISKHARVRILERNTITFLKLCDNRLRVTKVGDTVWVNLHTHQIDDTDSTAMLGVVEEIK